MGIKRNKRSRTLVNLLKAEYVKACITVSDIYSHVPVLYRYAKRCEHVTEMGSRTGVSTRAFLYANPKKFMSYDYQYTTPEPHLAKGVQCLKELMDQCRSAGMNCSYYGVDVLKTEIEETDFLLIDTFHCYEQLRQELALHAGKVRRYIAFHDTTLYGEHGEGFPQMDPNHPVRQNHMDCSGGIRKAIDEYMDVNKVWKIVHESRDNNGLIIIRKKSSISHHAA